MEVCAQQEGRHRKVERGLREMAGNVIGAAQKSTVCMKRSDSMSVGSIGSASDVASVGGASDEMDTEDSEKDTREGLLCSESSVSSVNNPQKLTADGLSLVLDNQRTLSVAQEELTKGDVTSPVIENKLSDNIKGYYTMRTRLLSQSAMILENGAAFGMDSSPRLCDNNRANQNVDLERCLSECNSGDGSPYGSNVCRNSGDSLDPESVTGESGMCNLGRHFSSSAEVVDTRSLESRVRMLKRDHQEGESNDRKDEECVIRGNQSGGFSDVIAKAESHTEGVSRRVSNPESATLRTVEADVMESSCSESMAEVEKSGLEAKLARVSKRRVYSKVREMAYRDADSSSDSDSESDSEEEEETEVVLDDLHNAKVLVNAAQPDSEKLIKREAMKMACPDDLLSDCVSSEDSSASSTDSSSGESSDSDDSSDSELSSADESDEEEEENEEDSRPRKPRQNAPSSKGRLEKNLPEVEYLKLSLPDSVRLTPLGSVSSIIGSLVIIQADPGTPALNMDSVLFKPDRTVIGQIFETFGPVVSPFYSVCFNSPEDIEKQGIQLKTGALFAPQNVDVTKYVFMEQLKKCRGSDASWKNDEEPPNEFLEFSDDEDESMAKNKKKRDRKRKDPRVNFHIGEDFQNQGPGQGNFQNNGLPTRPRKHRPLQRQMASRPLETFLSPRSSAPGMFGRYPPPHQFGRHSSSLGTAAFCNNTTQGPPPEMNWSQRFPGPWDPFPPRAQSPRGQFQRNPFLLRPPGCSPGNSGYSPMFQNPVVMGPPQSQSATQPPPPPVLPEQQPQTDQEKAQTFPHPVMGFSARNTCNPVPWSKSKSECDGEGVRTYSARKTHIPPPWQQKSPQSAVLEPSPGLPLPLLELPSCTGVSQIHFPPPLPSPHQQCALVNASSTTRMSLFALLPPPPPPPPPSLVPPGTSGVSVTTNVSGLAQQRPPPLMEPCSYSPAPTPISSQLLGMSGASPVPDKAPQGSGLNQRFMHSMGMPQFALANLPPPPVPPPAFHPRMMKSFGGSQYTTSKPH